MRRNFVLAALAVLLLAGCIASHPLRIDDKTWNAMTPEQRLEASKKQAELDAAEAQARAEAARLEIERHRAKEERLKAAQDAEDARLRELYEGLAPTPYVIAQPPGGAANTGSYLLVQPVPGGATVASPYGGGPLPYAVAGAVAPSLLHVSIAGGAARPRTGGGKTTGMRVEPFTIAPCEVRQVTVETGRISTSERVWVAFIPPTFFWDIWPDSEKRDLARYVSCDGDKLIREAFKRPALIPTTAPQTMLVHDGTTYHINGAIVTFAPASSPIPYKY